MSANGQRNSEYGNDEDWGAQKQLLAEKLHFFRWVESRKTCDLCLQFMQYLRGSKRIE